MKRGVPVCDLSARRAPARGAGGHAPPQEDFWPSEIVSGVFLGEIAKAERPTAKPGCCVCRIKGVTPLRAPEAAMQLVIRVKRGKKSVLILIAYRHPWLQKEQCMNKL